MLRQVNVLVLVIIGKKDIQMLVCLAEKSS
jgi:hypothetical protein